MKKLSIALILILIPVVVLADYMVYFKSTPEAVYRKLQGPTCGVKVDDAATDQAIMIADPALDNSDKAYWVALVTPEQLAVMRTKNAFLGKGLNEVQANKPASYKKMVNWTWELKTDPTKRFTVPMSDNTYQTGTLYRKVAEDIPIQTYFGYNPFTGDPK